MDKVIIINLNEETKKKEIRKEMDNIRNYINGALNRIAVTQDIKEVDEMINSLVYNINKYMNINVERIKDKC